MTAQLLESLESGRLTTNNCIHTHNVSQVDVRVDKRIIPDSYPRHDAYLDTGAAIITDERSQLVPAGINHRFTDFNFDVFGIKTPVGCNRPGAKGTMGTDDRITGIIHVKLSAIPDI